MYAIIRTGGRQFRAEPGKLLRLPSLPGEPGQNIRFEDVLLGVDGDTIKIGAPVVSGAAVVGELVRHGRGEKIVIFKHKRRKNYRRKQGHRQGFTEVKISSIEL